ncbi:MAG: S8 family serine peptidase, partial [Clostridia bacterium]|nr:S8 family serine peptidase [Clostridia bacterium]
MKKLLSIFLALIMIMAIAPTGFAKSPEVAPDPVNPDAVRTYSEEKTTDPNEIVTVMIKLKDAPVAAKVTDVNSKRANDLTAVLKNKQSRIEQKIAALFPEDQPMEVTFRYQLLFNGFAVKAPRSLIKKIAELPEVEKAFIAPSWGVPVTFEGEEDRLSTSVGFINADDAWSAGYTGKGTAIAVIDTGAVVNHNAFKTAPSDPKMSSSTISSVLSNNNMQCEKLYSGTLSASNLYYSGKVPFRFDYAGKDTDVSHSDAGSDHGSHVAGIACGYYSGSSYTGVAKDAQLVVMKVFGSSGGASWDTIMAALEDCAYLQVDSANMSLGAGCGFTSEGEEIDSVMTLLSNTGVNVACAAGNDGSSSGIQYYGSSYKGALAMNPDNGIVGSPGTYTESLCVACCQKSNATMVYFSSHGSTADLKIKPEVTAPGYSIYSATDSSLSGSTTGYGAKSGTSMSCPHVAGAQALITNYVNATWPSLTGKAKVDMVNRLLMCTANPISNTSPRTQGAGIIDLQKAITTKAYVTVDGCARPKLEIGDDPQKTGVYTLSFNVVNFGSSALSYTASTSVLTENTSTATVNSQSVRVLSGSTRNIASSATVSGDTSFTVPAGGTKKVTLTVTLNSSIKSEFDSTFPHGIYVDGVITLSGTVNLSIPWLGFYGNWNEASVFDRYTYIDAVKGVNKYNVHLSSYQTQVGAKQSSSSYMLFGVNPYATTSDWLADRCTLSPNGDKYYDQIDRIVYDLIRNAGEGGIKIWNEDTGEVYLDVDLSYFPKAWNYPNGNSSADFYHSSDNITSDMFSSWAPTGLAEGTHIVFNLYHYLQNPGFTPEQNECAEIRLPMTVDVTAPEVTAWNINGSNSSITVHDEHYAAWIGIYSNAACTTKITEQAITPASRGESTTINFSTTASTVYVKVGDYGHNTSEVITLTGMGGFDVTAVSNNEDYGTVSVSGSTITAYPAEGYYVESCDVISGTATCTISGNTIRVSAESDCTIRVNFAPKPSYTVSFVASGVAQGSQTAFVNDQIALPSSVTVDPEGWEFIGWVGDHVEETTAVPAYYAPGASYTVTGNATLYALFTRVENTGGDIIYQQTNDLAVGGRYIIASGNYAAKNTTYNTSNNHYVSVQSITVSNGLATLASSVDPETVLWEIESGSASAGWVFRNNAVGRYFTLGSDEYLCVGT